MSGKCPVLFHFLHSELFGFVLPTERDRVEFSGECSSNDLKFLNLSNIDWYSSDSIWDSSNYNYLSSENQIAVNFYFNPILGLTYASVDTLYFANQITFNCEWNDIFMTTNDIFGFIDTTTNKYIRSVANFSAFINSTELEYCSDDYAIFTTPPATTINNETVSISELNVIAESNECNLTCWECLTTIDSKNYQHDQILQLLFGNQISSDGNFADHNDSDSENCSCPTGESEFKQNSSNVVTMNLTDGSQLYITTLVDGDNNLVINIVIADWFGLGEECNLTYYVNIGTFLNVSALNVIRITFVITGITEEDKLQLEKAFTRFFANVFDVHTNNATVDINKLPLSDENEIESRRRLSVTIGDKAARTENSYVPFLSGSNSLNGVNIDLYEHNDIYSNQLYFDQDSAQDEDDSYQVDVIAITRCK